MDPPVDAERPRAWRRQAVQWSASYNMGSPAAAERRWRAAIDAGADFVATDHYEEFVGVLTKLRPRR